METAPIVLFVYNRPSHTLQTLESLKRNPLANQSKLFIYADGPKENASNQTIIDIEEVRRVIRLQQWCQEVHIIESEVNMGLANSIIKGVTEIVNEYGKIIVLEDDLELSPGFLTFLNNALEFYKDESKVMHISGYCFPVKSQLPETFFYQGTSCWGWATWKNRWQYFNNNTSVLLEKLEGRNLLKKFDLDGSGVFLSQLLGNINGEINTWAIKWQASVNLKGGLSLHPGKSLVRNIGHDGSGIHCNPSAYTSLYSSQITSQKVEVKKIHLEFSKKFRKKMKVYYKYNGVVNKSNEFKFFMLELRSNILSLFPDSLKSKVKHILKKNNDGKV